MPLQTTELVVGVIGAGAMGAGIAQVAAAAGHKVFLFDLRPGAAAEAIQGIAASLDRQVGRGKLSSDARVDQLSRLSPIDHIRFVASAGLVVEAVKEDLAVKRELFVQLESLVAEDALLATNTSSISVTAIGAALKRPRRFAGLHFFNPAPVMQLVEVVAGLATAPEVVDTLMALASAWGKYPVRTRSTPGFIVNRVARPFYAEALRVLYEGAAGPETIDALMRDGLGFKMGPFELMDLIGHDVNFAVTSSVHAAHFGDPRFSPSIIQREHVEAGWLGRKSGRGFYDYTPGGQRRVVEAWSGPAPTTVTVKSGLDYISPLLGRLQNAGVTLAFDANQTTELVVGNVALALTDGRTATERAASSGRDEFVVFDLMDWQDGARIAIAKADQSASESLSVAAGLFAAVNVQASPIDDIPGLIGMRTIAMLSNEAADSVLQGVGSAKDIDTAMQKGANYPIGPLAMADKLGPGRIVEVLRNLTDAYGEDRYRTSVLLRRKAMARSKFHSENE